MVRLLERDGFRHVISVSDGTDAVSVILDEQPEVVVLDVHMPGVDGFQVLRQLQSNHESMPLRSSRSAAMPRPGRVGR